MKKFFTIFTYIFFCLLLAFGCQNERESEPESLTPSPNEILESVYLPKSASLKIAKNSVMASVNDSIITYADVEREMDDLFQQYKEMAKPEKMDEFNSKLWRQALENVINGQLLLQEAEREEIHPEKEIVNKRIAKIAKRFRSHKKFQEQLTHLGISEEKLRQEIECDLKIKKLLDLHIPEIDQVSQEEVEDFYHINSENFWIPERIRASHILIKVSPKENAEIREQKKQILSQLQEKIKNGADFSQIARQHSDCNSKSKGGDLGYFERGKMVKAFEDAAFQLKIGEVSEMVKTEYGYHLIKLADRQEPKIIPLEQVQEKIVSFLKRQKRDLSVREYIRKLRINANIEYFGDYQP